MINEQLGGLQSGDVKYASFSAAWERMGGNVGHMHMHIVVVNTLRLEWGIAVVGLCQHHFTPRFALALVLRFAVQLLQAFLPCC